MTETQLSRRLRLIVITDPGLAHPRSVIDVVNESLAAGAPAIQLRDKSAAASDLLSTAQKLRELCHHAGALFFVNDRVDVALASGADGVHLGPDDIPVAAARAVLPRHFLIGSSTDDPETARTLAAHGADYLGCGTVYETSSKPDAGEVIGLEGLTRVADAVPVPVIGIGGVSVARSAAVAATSASGIAVIGAVMTAPDVGDAVRGLMTPWLGHE